MLGSEGVEKCKEPLKLPNIPWRCQGTYTPP